MLANDGRSSGGSSWIGRRRDVSCRAVKVWVGNELEILLKSVLVPIELSD